MKGLSQRGSVTLLTIILMLILVLFGLLGASVSMQSRHMSSHKVRNTSLRALAEGGLRYGYWQAEWNEASLPYKDADRAIGAGRCSVIVTDNSEAVADTIKVQATAKQGQAELTLTRVFAHNPKTRRYLLNAEATFLFFPGSGAMDALRIDLHAIEVEEGDTIELRVTGAWRAGSGSLVSSETNFLFSSNANLRPANTLLRVVGGVSSNVPEYVSRKRLGSLLTDISGDFSTSSKVEVVVPKNARFLFVGTDFVSETANVSLENYGLEIVKVADGS